MPRLLLAAKSNFPISRNRPCLAKHRTDACNLSSDKELRTRSTYINTFVFGHPTTDDQRVIDSRIDDRDGGCVAQRPFVGYRPIKTTIGDDRRGQGLGGGRSVPARYLRDYPEFNLKVYHQNGKNFLTQLNQ
uniref:Uncharacterized protein n=1 Tax=Romanomermis culicivorax TaxID=13658 RepID=A0A915ISN9_ROMCU